MISVAGGVGGCLNTAAPRLSIAEVRVTEVGEQGSTMVVVVRAENPNDKALPLGNVDYGVSLNGAPVFSGTRSAEGVLPRYGVLDIALPVSVPAGMRPVGEAGFRLSVVLHYLAPGKIAQTLYDAGLQRPTVSSAGEGTVDLGDG
jgi:hypothetical protein